MLKRTVIWVEIRNVFQVMHRVGVSLIEMLHWSEDKKLWEVRQRIEDIERKEKLKKIGEVWLKGKEEEIVENNKSKNVKTENTTDCIIDGTTLNRNSLYEIEKELLKRMNMKSKGLATCYSSSSLCHRNKFNILIHLYYQYLIIIQNT